MKKPNRWTRLDQLSAELKSVADFPASLMPSVVDRLEDALASDSREATVALAEQLAELSARMLAVAPPEVMQMLRDQANADSPTAAAYMIGQIGFAQLFAAQVSDRAVNADFVRAFDDPRYVGVLRALFEQDQNNKVLASRLDLQEETISRKLTELRSLGLSDFRRIGAHHVNFLTPAARQLAAQRFAETDTTPRIQPEIKALIEALLNEDSVPAYMTCPPSFSLARPHCLIMQ